MLIGIHLCSDSTIGSIRNGHPTNILFTIILNEAPGQKIVQRTKFGFI